MDKLTHTRRQAIVLDIARLAGEKYIFPEKGLEIARAIQSQLEQGSYDEILDPHEFADRLTTDLRQASNDPHWEVSYDSALTSTLYAEEEEQTEEGLAQLKESIFRSNFGIAKVEHLKLPGTSTRPSWWTNRFWRVMWANMETASFV